MQYHSVTAPAWADPDQTQLNCAVDFVGIGPVNFTASEDDSEAHSREIFARAVAGDFGEVQAYIAPPIPPAYPTRDAAKRAVVRWIDGLTAQVLDQYPAAVRARWAIEEAAARAVIDGDYTPDQLALVTNEGAAKGRTPAEHAARIIAHADNFRAIADQVNTLFLAIDGQLDAAASPAEFEAILEWGKEQAAPLASQYGLAL